MVSIRCITELISRRYIATDTKHRGFGNTHRKQRSMTDFDVYGFLDWCNRNKKLVWFSNIKINLGINAITLRKSLNRLQDEGEIQEYRLWVDLDKKDRLGRNHRVFYKGYKVRDTHREYLY